MWIKYRDLRWPPEKKVVLLHRKKITECALGKGIGAGAMAGVHQTAGRSSPCTPGPAWVSPAAHPAGIPACARSLRVQSILEITDGSCQISQQNCSLKSSERCSFANKTVTNGMNGRKKDWKRKTSTPRACCLSGKAVTPNEARARACQGPTCPATPTPALAG